MPEDPPATIFGHSSAATSCRAPEAAAMSSLLPFSSFLFFSILSIL